MITLHRRRQDFFPRKISVSTVVRLQTARQNSWRDADADADADGWGAQCTAGPLTCRAFSYVSSSDAEVWLECRIHGVHHDKRHAVATSRKAAGMRPDEVYELFSICLILSAKLGPGVYSASSKNEYQKQKNNVSGEQSAAGA
jgi:hypothetical protein